MFEDVILGQGFARICAFLGLTEIQPARLMVHEGQPLDMSADQRQVAAEWLAPQYDAAARVLGHMPDAWGRKG